MFKNIWNQNLWLSKKIWLTYCLLVRIAWFVVIPVTLIVIGNAINAAARYPMRAIVIVLIIIAYCRYDKKRVMTKF